MKHASPLVNGGPSGKKRQMVSLLVMCPQVLMLILWAFSSQRSEKAVLAYGVLLAFTFVGVTLASEKGKIRLTYWIGYLYIAWYMLSRLLLGDLYLERSSLYFARTVVSYAVALPFAFVSQDRRKRCLDVVAFLYAAAFTALALVGLLTVVLGHDIIIPVLHTRVYMEGRLFAGQHPNGSAMLFLMAMLFTVYLMARYPRKWLLIAGSLMLLCQYAGIAFTVSRTVMIEVALAAGALAFWAVMRIPRAVPARWPRAARAAVAVVLALVCCVLCYAGFNGCTEWSQSFSSQAETAEAAQTVVVEQRPLLEDLSTLTGRTFIYQNVLKYVQMHPETLATGLLEKDIVTNIQREVDPNFWLAHNGWLQTLLTVGLPGLMFALYFTALTVKLAVKQLLLRCQSGSLADKILLLLPVLLVLNCLTECVLFVEQFSVGNFAYLLCLGYALEADCAESGTKASVSR